jgi:hypothetical protein
VTRTFLALAAATALDLTDRDGVARPLLRRGALRLTGSRRAPAQRLGASYLRIDPPTPEELVRAASPAPPHAVGAAPAESARLEPPIEEAESDWIEGTETEKTGEADDKAPR